MSNDSCISLPLDGINVLDLTRLIPGALCTSILGDAGAEVIKVEEVNIGDYERQIQPFNGPMASRFLILNRNKKSIAVNLKEEAGREVFIRMVSRADVLVEGFRPGTMKKLGLDYESLHQINHRLIYCSISSFGQDGPYRDVVAHDINILGMAGFFDIMETGSGVPVIPGIQIADSVAGMNAALAILIGLINRTRTGNGQLLDISMYDGVIAWLFDAVRHVFAGKDVPRKGQGRLSGGLPNYNLYETKDQRYIAVGSLENKFKRVLLRELGWKEPDGGEGEATTSQVKDSDAELRTFLADTMKTKSRDEWMERLGHLNICVTPVHTLTEALDNPQLAFRQMVVEIDHPAVGRTRQIGSPLASSYTSMDPNRLPAPDLGQHSLEILSRLGYTDNQIDDLLKNNAVRSSQTHPTARQHGATV